MAITATWDMMLTIVDAFTHGQDNVSGTPSIKSKLSGLSGTLTSSSTVPVTQKYVDSFDLVAGAATINMTALDQGNLPDVDASGLKPQLFIFHSESDNTDEITISDGAANGHDIFGDASGQVTLPIGGAIMFYGADGLDDIGASDLSIDFASSDLDATVNVAMVFG